MGDTDYGAELAKLKATIMEEQAKVKRCQAKGLRFKNKFPKLMKEYTALLQKATRQHAHPQVPLND